MVCAQPSSPKPWHVGDLVHRFPIPEGQDLAPAQHSRYAQVPGGPGGGQLQVHVGDGLRSGRAEVPESDQQGDDQTGGELAARGRARAHDVHTTCCAHTESTRLRAQVGELSIVKFGGGAGTEILLPFSQQFTDSDGSKIISQVGCTGPVGLETMP